MIRTIMLFVIVVIAAIMIWCTPVEAKVERHKAGITYEQAVKSGRKSLNKAQKKSIRMIIDEVLERHRRMEYLPVPTYPIPLYDSINWEDLKNVA
jgi:hypothetical protein